MKRVIVAGMVMVAVMLFGLSPLALASADSGGNRLPGQLALKLYSQHVQLPGQTDSSGDRNPAMEHHEHMMEDCPMMDEGMCEMMCDMMGHDHCCGSSEDCEQWCEDHGHH